MAIIISKGGKDAHKVEQSVVSDEDFLQKYVSQNPDSLPLNDVKDDVRLLVVGREFPTSSGPIDVLAVDREGDLYIIEANLFKNPDKRRVVAQMLDYGAALWTGYDQVDFVAEVDRLLAKSGGVSLAARMAEMYALTLDETLAAIQQLKRNLSDGNIKFVVLMDHLHDALRDMILFINQKSRFDILAVEMEFYQHGELEIVIPKLFGAEVHKEVASATSGLGSRRKWDKESFFVEAEAQVEPKELQAVRRLYEFAEAGAYKISWGTGSARGSFNPKHLKASPRSIFTVYTDGMLNLNFEWLGRDDVGTKYRERLKAELTAAELFDLPDDEKDVGVEASEWAPNVEVLIRALERALAKA